MSSCAASPRPSRRQPARLATSSVATAARNSCSSSPRPSVEEGAVLTEKLRNLVQRQRFAIEGGNELAVTISIGIAGGSGNQLRMDTLVRDADAAMYSAKSLGRNQTYIFAEPDDDARVPRAPISAAGRARALEIGQWARDAAATALTSVLAPLPHYRGQPSALIASIVVSMGKQLDLPDAELDRLRVAALLHDVGKVAVPQEILEKPAATDLGGMADRGPAPAHRPGHPRAGGGAQGRGPDHPPPSRALSPVTATPTACVATRSRSEPGSWRSPTPTTR